MASQQEETVGKPGIVDPSGAPVLPDVLPPLTDKQAEEAEAHRSTAALVVHETIRKNGEEELARPLRALAWSGFAAGLSMGFSVLVEAMLYSFTPDAAWKPLVVGLGYPVGFLIVIIGRQQLFTENTLTPIIPLLTHRSLRVLRGVLRLWAVVFTANLTGAHAFALAMARTNVMRPEVREAMRQLSLATAGVTPGEAMLRGIFAGWLIATMVWMLAATESATARILIIGILTYVVAIANLTHVIVGSTEMLFLVMSGAKSWLTYSTAYMLPTLAGNIIGGVALVSALNHAQVVAGRTSPTAL